MFNLFESQSADDVWLAAATKIVGRHAETACVQPSRAGDTVELLHAAISIADPIQRWVVSRTPAINPAFAIAEVIWIITGRNDSAFLKLFNSRLHEFAGNGVTFHGAYGYRLRQGLTFDQLQRAYVALSENKDSRQVVLQIWDGNIDMPAATGQPQTDDIPCNVMSLLKIRDSALEWTQIIRSNDLFRGFPYNIIQFTTLQEVMAGWLGVSLGSYNQLSDSLHAYTDSIPHLQLTDPIVPEPNTDSLALPYEDSNAVFAELAARVEKMLDPNVSMATLTAIANWQAPPAFRNMLLVLVAEIARRRKWPQIAAELIEGCSNPIFCQMWMQWMDRIGRVK